VSARRRASATCRRLSCFGRHIAVGGLFRDGPPQATATCRRGDPEVRRVNGVGEGTSHTATASADPVCNTGRAVGAGGTRLARRRPAPCQTTVRAHGPAMRARGHDAASCGGKAGPPGPHSQLPGAPPLRSAARARRTIPQSRHGLYSPPRLVKTIPLEEPFHKHNWDYCLSCTKRPLV
jgi:hypothetical protein